jgi:hypothetical protein
MLNESQRAHLDAVVRELDDDLFIESARFDTHDNLELVLCREFVCFRPLHITTGEVDIAAALAGNLIAQQTLEKHLRSRLEGLL